MRRTVAVAAELAGLPAARRLVALGRDMTTVDRSRECGCGLLHRRAGRALSGYRRPLLLAGDD